MLITPITEDEVKAAAELHEIFVIAARICCHIDCITVPERLRMLWRNQPGEPYVYRTVEVQFRAPEQEPKWSTEFISRGISVPSVQHDQLAPVTRVQPSLRERIWASLDDAQQWVKGNALGDSSNAYWRGYAEGLKLAFDLATDEETRQFQESGRFGGVKP